MNRIFGKAKEKAPPPNLLDVITGVSVKLCLYVYNYYEPTDAIRLTHP